MAVAGVAAQEPSRSVSDAILAPVIVTAPPPMAASSELLIPGQDFELLPHGRPADVLRLVPGLIMSQHQGGGKAEQYMLRGFDADHGTDVALFVDGMPVNLRSHAHGQGYADLHFLIPETIKQVDAFKGPYYVEYGDFATAGAIDFVTLDTVPENLVEAAGGSFGTQRYLTLLSPTRDRVKTLVALEAYTSDGPFDRPQDYKRLNAFAKASATLGDGVDGSIWASYLRSSWFGSGQIPARAVRAGLIDRFGSIDNSEGGRTERASVNGQPSRPRPTSSRSGPGASTTRSISSRTSRSSSTIRPTVTGSSRPTGTASWGGSTPGMSTGAPCWACRCRAWRACSTASTGRG